MMRRRARQPDLRALAWVLSGCCCGSVGAQQEIFTTNPLDREISAGLAVDQEQTEGELLAGESIGQVFTAGANRLERLDFVTKNRTDPAPGRIGLWEWTGDHGTSTQGEPLWGDDLQFHGADAPYLRHYFPRVDLQTGRQYLIECSRPSEWFYMAGAKTDVYPGGFALTNGTVREEWDLWFRTFVLAAQPAGPLPHRSLPELEARHPTPPRERGEVTRDLYLQIVREHVERSWESWEREQGYRAAELMYFGGFLFRHADDARWPERVERWLTDAERQLQEHEDYGGSPWYVEHMGWGIRWFRGNDLWTEEVEQLARRVMLTATRRLAESLERGAMNRTMWDVQLTRLAADLYPDAPEAAEWRAFSDEAWHDWADFDDTDEDSSHYNAVFLHFMLGHAYLTDQLDLFQRPGMRAFMGRYAQLITPSGMMVGWGDSVGCGADWGAWVAAFEASATATLGEGDKWAATKLLEGHRRYILDDDPLQRGYEDINSLPLAYLLATEAEWLQPAETVMGSGVVTTTYPRYNPPQARREEGLPYYSLEDRETPWKLVMRHGAGDDAYYALFGLLPHGGHGHADAPALLSLYANGTQLLHDTAYFHKDWADHNLLFGVRVNGGSIGDAPTETEVTACSDWEGLCHADIAWHDYGGWGLQLRREILFAKGLGWWVRDRTEAEEACEWFLGPLWHVDRILQRGSTWFDVDYPVPTSFAWPVANGTDHLLVYFTPRDGAQVDYADMTHRVDPERPWYSSHPWALYQCEGPVTLSAERQAAFDTLLIPLRESESAEEVARSVEVVLDEGGAKVLRLERGGETWVLALNPARRTLQVGPFESPMRATVVRLRPGAEPWMGTTGH